MDYAIIGGDERMEYLAGHLRRAGFDARRLFDADDDAGAGMMDAARGARRIVANWPPKLGGADASLDEILSAAGQDAALLLCGPGVPGELPGGRAAVNLWADEALQRENAGLTAEGAVSAAMRAGRRCIRDTRCVVIGWGRIGSALSELLTAMGARVVVATRSEAHRHRAIERGAEAVPLSALGDALPEAGLVFSTPPAPVLDDSLLARVSPEAMVIDLASPPYGVDLRAAWARGIRAWREPGLPGRYCPESAGLALMRAIMRWEEGGFDHE